MTTIPDDMVERVARAIADKMHAGGDFGMTGADAYRRRSAEFMSLARAAIEAMQPAILAERERCVAEIASLREQLAESDRNAEKLEALLDPHVSWEGKPPAAMLAAEKRGEERERERRDDVEETLWEVQQWCKAYPIAIFPEPDFEKARQLLEAGGMTLDAISASNMRHVVTQISTMIAAAIRKGSD